MSTMTVDVAACNQLCVSDHKLLSFQGLQQQVSMLVLSIIVFFSND